MNDTNYHGSHVLGFRFVFTFFKESHRIGNGNNKITTTTPDPPFENMAHSYCHGTWQNKTVVRKYRFFSEAYEPLPDPTTSVRYQWTSCKKMLFCIIITLHPSIVLAFSSWVEHLGKILTDLVKISFPTELLQYVLQWLLLLQKVKHGSKFADTVSLLYYPTGKGSMSASKWSLNLREACPIWTVWCSSCVVAERILNLIKFTSKSVNTVGIKWVLGTLLQYIFTLKFKKNFS